MPDKINGFSQAQNYSDYFNEIWGKSKPLVKLFKNDIGEYLYDTGTDKILKCEPLAFTILEKFLIQDVDLAITEILSEYEEKESLDSIQKIVGAIESEKILLLKSEDVHFFSKDLMELTELSQTALGMLILEVTESCNMRCKYCIFSSLVPESRSHGSKHMELSTAYRALDYLAEHSSKLDSAFITFYGGEPLLRFPFIQSCVVYARQKMSGKKLTFSLTTNALLLNKEMAQYFYDENFGLNVSIDGPAEIHDRFRVDCEGKGTFAKAIKGLQDAVEIYGESARDRIHLSMVYTPPFSAKKLDRIASLWEEYPWLKDIKSSITYPHEGSISWGDVHDSNDLSENKNMGDWAFERYLADYIAKKKQNPLVSEIVNGVLIKIFLRTTQTTTSNIIPLNGCCMPAVRKIFVNTVGEIALCERVHQTVPKLGHIETGIDIEKAKTFFLDQYAESCFPYCSNCWANKLCGMCYLEIYKNQQLDLEKKGNLCDKMRKSLETSLKLYTTLLKIDPQGLNYLEDIVLT